MIERWNKPGASQLGREAGDYGVGAAHHRFEMLYLKVEIEPFKLKTRHFKVMMEHLKVEMRHFKPEMRHLKIEKEHPKFKTRRFNLKMGHFKLNMPRPKVVLKHSNLVFPLILNDLLKMAFRRSPAGDHAKRLLIWSRPL